MFHAKTGRENILLMVVFNHRVQLKHLKIASLQMILCQDNGHIYMHVLKLSIASASVHLRARAFAITADIYDNVVAHFFFILL